MYSNWRFVGLHFVRLNMPNFCTFAYLSHEYFSCYSLQLFWIDLIFLELELKPNSISLVWFGLLDLALRLPCGSTGLSLSSRWDFDTFRTQFHTLAVSFTSFQPLISRKFLLSLAKGLESMLLSSSFQRHIFFHSAYKLWANTLNFLQGVSTFCNTVIKGNAQWVSREFLQDLSPELRSSLCTCSSSLPAVP